LKSDLATCPNWPSLHARIMALGSSFPDMQETVA